MKRYIKVDTLKEIEQVLQETLVIGTVGVIVFEGNLCPVTILSLTKEYIRVTKPNFSDRIFSGIQVALELCSKRGCLVLQTEVIEVSESNGEGIVLAIPGTFTNIFLRRFWRIPVNLPVEIKPHAHPRKIRGLIRNLSAGGMLVVVEEPLEVGGSVDIYFSLTIYEKSKEKQFHLMGSVTHISFTERDSLVSLKFIGMFPEDEMQINDFVLKILSDSCPKLNV